MAFWNRKKTKNNSIAIRSVSVGQLSGFESSSTPVSKIKSIKPIVLNYAQHAISGRGTFAPAEYDLAEIGVIEDVDSYVRQAFKKKLALMFKEGMGYSGANQNTIRYIKARMAQIARATDIPTVDLIKRVAASLIRTSNAFLVKKRDSKASGGLVRRTPNGKRLQPVAGYFPVAPETMNVSVDQATGQVVGWRQQLPDGRFKDYSPEDVVHFVVDRREGFIFGVPGLVPVKDDIRALRQIEENIEMLLYQHLFPLFHYTVGTETAPAGYTEAGDREIDLVKDEIRMMPSEGAIVTPERHKIEAIGSEGRAIRAEGYIDHFKKRIFAGLGMSPIDMAELDTSNRGTATVVSRQLIDTIKDVQDELEIQWNHQIIYELLLESNFGDSVLEEKNMVYLVFNEIDIANKMEQEKHHLEMFQGNAITYTELRSLMNREPITVPVDGQDQDPNRYPEWFDTHWKLFGEPENLIRAVDEPFSSAAKLAALSRSTGLTETDLQATKQEKEQSEIRRQTAVSQSNQRSQQDNFIKSSFLQLENDLSYEISVNSEKVKNISYLNSLIRMWASELNKQFSSFAFSQMIKGFNDYTSNNSANAELFIQVGRKMIQDRSSFYIEKLSNDIISFLNRRIDLKSYNDTLSGDNSQILEELHLVFGASKYRTDLIWDTELRKSYNLGKILGMKYLDKDGFYLIAKEDSCDRCKGIHNKFISVLDIDLESIPPLHPNSRLEISDTKDVTGRQ